MQTSIFFISEISDQKFQIFLKLFQTFEETVFLFFVKLEEFLTNFRLFDLNIKNFGHLIQS
jgi:hypothetical protein